jgi:rhamnose utilization protein RhaD (predicted bifunctional aldolase and dehydrogenase)
MQSRWIDRDAEATVDRHAAAGIPRELALRVYSTRLLGRDPRLVLHGGGNTSVKMRMRDLVGDEIEAMYIKGTGADMAAIEPAGMPAVRLATLRGLRTFGDLPDEDMARVQRASLIDPMAPNPSLELLLHAFVPHAFVDHTHANAVLSLIDQPDGAQRVTEVYDARIGLVPYVRPGFGLAKAAASVFDANPAVEGLILDKHGVFTFGATAREAYERMIATVSRGEGAHRRMILQFRSSDAILNFVNGAELARYAQSLVITPDFTIRTKSAPLILPAPEAGKLDAFKRAVAQAASAYVENYKCYFTHHNARVGGGKIMLDPLPRVVLVPGLGLFGLGRTARDARIAAALAEAAVSAGSRRSRKATCSTASTGRSSRPSSAARPRSRWLARSRR